MKNKVLEQLQSYELPPNVIAGVMGNIDVETGGTFDPSTKQVKGNGYGLFQFDFLKPYYKEWLKQNKMKDTAESQVDFFVDTIYGKSQDILGRKNARNLRQALSSASSPEEAAKVLSEGWFKPGKPHLERRMAAAGTYGATPQPSQPLQAPQVEEESLLNPLLRTTDELWGRVKRFWGL